MAVACFTSPARLPLVWSGHGTPTLISLPQIGFEWDRIVLRRMLTKIISQPQADNKARRLPRLKVGMSIRVCE